MRDKFDEMYLKLVNANSFYTKGSHDDALKIYLDVIENYIPDKDEPYKNACNIYLEKSDKENAKKIAHLAIERFKQKDIKGDAEFFLEIINSADEKKKKRTNKLKGLSFLANLNLFQNVFLVVAVAIIIVVSIILSLPNKLNKLIFMNFLLFSFVFVFEILKDIKKNYKVGLKSSLLMFFIILTIYGGTHIPKEEWPKFLSFEDSKNFAKTRASVGFGEVDEDTDDEDEKSDRFKKGELDKLEKFSKKLTGLESYLLKVQKNKILLWLNVYPGTSKKECQDIASQLLNELSLIKGYDKPTDDTLGELYKNYKVTVKAYVRNQLIYSSRTRKNILIEE